MTPAVQVDKNCLRVDAAGLTCCTDQAVRMSVHVSLVMNTPKQ